jgi:probable DNA repair protein
MPAAFPALEFPALLARLAEAPAGLSVVTPNHRLAQSLIRETDARHLAVGARSWDEPDVLHWGAWLERCHEDAAFSPGCEGVPALLSAEEEQLLWEEAVRASRWRDELPSVQAIAALAAEAWSLAHAWRIEGALGTTPGNEDADAFNAWRAHYEARTAEEDLIDAARLPKRVEAWLADGAIARPATLVLHAFDLITPQQEALFSACSRAGIEVLACAAPRVEGEVRRVEPDSPRRELEAAARWARSRLEHAAEAGAGTPRVAVIVPELAKRRAEVERIFTRTFAPASGEAGAYFNLSAGEPLASRPMVDAALAIVELSGAAIDYDRASRLLRSPFIAGAEAERLGRARLDAALRRVVPARLTLRRLRALAGEAASHRGAAACPHLTTLLDALIALGTDPAGAPPHAWGRRFSAALDAAGWPGERTLDSAEFQTLGKFREVLATVAALGSVATAWKPVQARAQLVRLATDTQFQPASGEAPVQVLGILESAGLAFDHLWVTGLTEEAWPMAPRLHPLIPPALQRRAGIPQASAERSLEVDDALTQAWMGAAGEVILSSARADGDRLLLASPLIASIPVVQESELAIPDYPSLRTALFAVGREKDAIDMREDLLAPPLGEGPAPGGTGILADQAACPFRAFARYRLDARALERPEPGLGPPERGRLLHEMMAQLWKTLRDHATLVSTPALELERAIHEAAAYAIAKMRAERPGAIDERFGELERERLEGIAREWLQIERDRAPFAVVSREAKMTLSAGNLRLTGRVDRMDRLEGGGLAVIDYKSGRVGVGAWIGERPDDVQLPLYTLAAEEDVNAVAFARLKTGELAFVGLSRDAGVLPGVNTVEKDRVAKKIAANWSELLGRWREEVARLGENFASGDAAVDPKRLLNTCERCDLKPLCRVHERIGALMEEEMEEDGE